MEKIGEILRVHNLSAGYDAIFKIKNISFSLYEGDFLAILGKNGSGKTTLLKAILGFVPKVAGEVIVEGKSVSSLSQKKIAKIISYVPQMNFTPFPFTVKEIVEMGRYPYKGRFEKNSDETVFEAMEITKVLDFKDRKILELSSGEIQRVFIAKALAQDTPIIFLDEPSSHLDINFQIEVYEILEELVKKKKKTLLVTEHNLNLASLYSKKILFLVEGKIFKNGKVSEMLERENIKKVYDAEVKILKESPDSPPLIFPEKR
ncbi:MAG: ABC transporter ATP-binding protein [Acidobacteriota bacterium]